MKIVVSIPAYNEEKNIGNVIQKVKKAMDENKYKYKILVVNDGSRDKTAEIAKKEGAIVYSHERNLGLAETFRTEIEKCLELNPEIIVHIDADDQYLPSEIPKLVKEVENGYDLVLGSRFLGTIEEMPFLKKLGNRTFSKVISSITRRNITDPQTGFRAFTKEVAEKIQINSSYTYTQEQVIRVAKNKFKIKEVPIYFARRGMKTKSRLMRGPFHYASSAGINLLRVYRDYDPLRFFGRVGLFFIVIGLLIGLILLLQSYILGFPSGFWDKHIPTLILIVLLFFGGFQLIFFGFLADMNKK